MKINDPEVAGNISGSVTSTGSFGTGQFAGNITPKTDNTSDLGSSTNRFANIYSADIQLTNEGAGGNEVDGTMGSWTIQEGENDIFIINRKFNKRYKIVLEELD
jgi:hypothetical protein|tara:strand:- start:251 stop:562 length:312 start_codon:yes stop_codon:yes gene_type:complete